jgi:hypothetical protein
MTNSNVRRSTTAAAVDAERRRLELHRTSLETGACGACGRDGPCRDANEAAGFLAERGLLVPEPPRRSGGRLRRLAYRALRLLKPT